VVEVRARELDLEVARRVDGEKQRLSEQQDLRLKEKDKLIEDLRKALEDAKRKSEQGSQERQGEVLEIDIEAELARRFPRDAILPVAGGRRVTTKGPCAGRGYHRTVLRGGRRVASIVRCPCIDQNGQPSERLRVIW
jgi:Uncharacterized protein conserved in bacteria (DUF2130)